MFFLVNFQKAHAQDMGVTSLITPGSPVCAASNQMVVVKIKNFDTDTIKYALKNVVVTVKVSGASTQTFKDTLRLGSLAADSTQDVTVTLHCNLSVAGTDVFKAYTAVTGGDANALNDTLAGVSVIVKPLPSAHITAYDTTTFCQGDSVILVSDSTSGNLWTGGSTNDTLVVSTSGKYTVTVTGGGCTATSDTTKITVNPFPAVPVITAHGSTAFCLGGHVILSSSSMTGNHWSGGTMHDSVLITTAGSYSDTVTIGGCSTVSAASTTVIVHPLPTVSLLAFTTTPCAQAPAFSLTGGSPAGGIYSGIGVDSVGKFHPNEAGHIQGITYTVTDSNSCSNSASQNITVLACIAGIEENSDSQGINVYPNPSNNGAINITIKNVNFSELLISIVDIQGKEVLKTTDKNIQQQGDYNKQINIANLAKGVYFLKLNGGNGSTGDVLQIRKLIVE
jgi:hypothetical protein